MGTRVFVAGGTGTIGIPLVRALVAAGHEVVASTRTAGKADLVRSLGATPAVVDALDPAALERVVVAARPRHVIHQLTALPAAGVRRARDLAPTNRLRDEGTTNLVRAALAAGAHRIIAGSFAVLGAAEDKPGENDPAVLAVRSLESQVLDAARSGALQGIVLRYGLFYGAGSPATRELIDMVRRRRMPTVRNDSGLLPFIHLDDAVSATVAALDRGTPGATYNIVDDRPTSFSGMVDELARVAGSPQPFTVPLWLVRLMAPYMARLLTTRLSLSNADARRDLQWAPRFSSYLEGLRSDVPGGGAR